MQIDVSIAMYVSQLHKTGLLKGDDSTDLFFHRLTDLSVSHCLSTEVASSVYAKLIYSILKGSSKLSILAKVLAVTVKYIHKDAEEKRTSFNARPYFRLFVNWILDLCSLDPVSNGANFPIVDCLVPRLMVWCKQILP